MFAIQPAQKEASSTTEELSPNCCTPNILPCRIHHDGPVDNISRYWTPVTDEKGLQIAYFRGRKLRGRRVAIPEGYQGVVAITTDKTLPVKQNNHSIEDLDVEPEEPVKILEQQATFDELLVWDHEAIPATDDSFVKGVEEWLKFAEVMHSSPSSDANSKQKST
ncbi:hypothetical protein ASPZODRAFT_131581 [Penicilliopsis zonata CBS 506.65]|uniref:Uncharacterized protein n=1 Tax=Penicilliopsis zonata CBS 506.65 TaxID=1073090 RepID=A0A1L9SL18_9EURO|nr:hypothetical protein ASPZODRAFT_131581 [Penicilliopsis zonata CBS 506.65]OJJ47962.1 hypothetical protein ASPZODRAFT_131581 [Penicilliopsis zonata CBS 506.65]